MCDICGGELNCRENSKDARLRSNKIYEFNKRISKLESVLSKIHGVNFENMIKKNKRIFELELAIEDIHKIVGEEGKIEAVWEVFDKVQQLCEQALTSLREDVS